MQTSSALLLDTHVWIWLMQGGDTRLSGGSALQAIVDAGRHSGIAVSAISVWEVAMLEAKGRLVLGSPISEWIEASLSAPGIAMAPLSPTIAIDSTRLPGDFHGDPADRILVATARHLRCPLVTADRRILDYSGSGHVRTIEV